MRKYIYYFLIIFLFLIVGQSILKRDCSTNTLYHRYLKNTIVANFSPESNIHNSHLFAVTNSHNESDDVKATVSMTGSDPSQGVSPSGTVKPKYFVTLFPMKQQLSSQILYDRFSNQDDASIVNPTETNFSDVDEATEEIEESEDIPSSNPTLSVPTISVSKFFSRVVRSIFSDETVSDDSSAVSLALTNVVQKFLPTELPDLPSEVPTFPLELTEEPLPNVRNPHDLFPYYRRRYLKFRKVSLAITRDWRMYYIKWHAYTIKRKKDKRAVPPPSPKPTPSPPPIHEKADFNGMDPPNANFTIQPRPWKENQVIQIRYFKGNKEVPEEEVMYDGVDNPDIFSFALISVTTYSRIFFITHFLARWKGPISVVVFGMKDMEDAILKYYNHHYYESRLTTILYLVDNVSDESIDFPINKLRNLGIKSTHTTHYLVIDMDVWPSNSLYESLHYIPSYILIDDENAVVLPLLFYDLGVMLPQCRELSSCIKLGSKYLPRNKVEVDACLRARVCMYHKADLLTHGYMNNIWVHWRRSNVTRLSCFMNDYQEPYVLLKRSPNTPLFDERFKNYGYNKIQLIEHLKYKGYRFYILMNSFAIDMPHRGSTFKAQFIKSMNNTDSMYSLYKAYQEDLVKKYPSSPYRIPICTNPKLTNIYVKTSLSVCCKNESAIRIGKFFLIYITSSSFAMIRVLDLYNFGDESIVTNPVYNAMFSCVPHLKQDAYKKQVTLLIPMASSLTSNHFSSSFIQSHIAIPSPVYKDVFMTYSGKTLEINNKYVQTKVDKWNGVGFPEERCCRILYNDVISVEGNAEFRILLVDKPLEGSFYPLQVFPQSNVLFHSGHISEVFEYFVGHQQATELVESIQKSINISFLHSILHFPSLFTFSTTTTS